jgi:hypothetical protein
MAGVLVGVLVGVLARALAGLPRLLENDDAGGVRIRVGGRVRRECLMIPGDFSAAGSCPAGSCPALDVEGDGLAREGLD